MGARVEVCVPDAEDEPVMHTYFGFGHCRVVYGMCASTRVVSAAACSVDPPWNTYEPNPTPMSGHASARRQHNLRYESKNLEHLENSRTKNKETS